jgi:hypothetical protein
VNCYLISTPSIRNSTRRRLVLEIEIAIVVENVTDIVTVIGSENENENGSESENENENDPVGNQFLM